MAQQATPAAHSHWALGVSVNGLHYKATTLAKLRYYLHLYRLVHQDGTLLPNQYHDHSGGNSKPVPLPHLQAPWPSDGHHLQQGTAVCIKVHTCIVGVLQH